LPDLARHFDRSGDWENATRYLHLAGQQALARSAFREALGYAARGLELVGSRRHLKAALRVLQAQSQRQAYFVEYL
jgi:predicted ATPase